MVSQISLEMIFLKFQITNDLRHQCHCMFKENLEILESWFKQCRWGESEGPPANAMACPSLKRDGNK